MPKQAMPIVPMRLDPEVYETIGKLAALNPWMTKQDVARMAMKIGVDKLKEGTDIRFKGLANKEAK